MGLAEGGAHLCVPLALQDTAVWNKCSLSLNSLNSGAEFRPCPIRFVVASLVLTPAGRDVPSVVRVSVNKSTSVVFVSTNEPLLCFGQ